MSAKPQNTTARTDDNSGSDNNTLINEDEDKLDFELLKRRIKQTRRSHSSSTSPVDSSSSTPDSDQGYSRRSDDEEVWPLQLNIRHIRNYILGDILGTGSYAEVRECIHMQTLERCAVKIVDERYLQRQAPQALQNQLQELKLLPSLKHSNVIQMREYIREGSKIYIFLEFCSFELNKLLRELPQNRLPLPLGKNLFRQVLSAIEYLHSRGIVHRDIKPQNLLINNMGQLKLIDFGVSQILPRWQQTDECSAFEGSPLFQSPELILLAENEQADPLYSGFKVDVWSMGVTLYLMLYGQYPFFKEALLQLYDQILAEPLKFPSVLDSRSQQRLVGDLLSRMLDKDPQRRSSIGDIQQHPWLSLPDSDSFHSVAFNSISQHSELIARCHLADTLSSCDHPAPQAETFAESERPFRDLYRSTSCLAYLHSYHFPEFQPTKVQSSSRRNSLNSSSNSSLHDRVSSPHDILDEKAVEWGTEIQYRLLKLPRIRANRMRQKKQRSRRSQSIDRHTTLAHDDEPKERPESSSTRDSTRSDRSHLTTRHTDTSTQLERDSGSAETKRLHHMRCKSV